MPKYAASHQNGAHLLIITPEIGGDSNRRKMKENEVLRRRIGEESDPRKCEYGVFTSALLPIRKF